MVENWESKSLTGKGRLEWGQWGSSQEEEEAFGSGLEEGKTFDYLSYKEGLPGIHMYHVLGVLV